MTKLNETGLWTLKVAFEIQVYQTALNGMLTSDLMCLVEAVADMSYLSLWFVNQQERSDQCK